MSFFSAGLIVLSFVGFVFLCKNISCRACKCNCVDSFLPGSLIFLHAWGVMYSRCSFLTQTGRSFGKKPFCSFVLFSGACFQALLLLGMKSFKRKCKFVFKKELGNYDVESCLSWQVTGFARSMVVHFKYTSFIVYRILPGLSRGCFGCCAKPPTISEAGATSKGLRDQERLVKKYSMSDDFWSTSTGEMENSVVHSQGSLSSISTLNQPLDPCCNAGSTSNPPEFVNRGKFKSLTESFFLVKYKNFASLSPFSFHSAILFTDASVSWNATYESLLGSNRPLSRPVPLAEMVDFLVDVWEQEGLCLFLFFCCFQTFWIAQKGKCTTVSIFNELICLLPEHHYLLATVLLKPIKASPLYRAGIRVANFDLIYGLLFFLEQPQGLLGEGLCLIPDHCRSDTSLQSVA
ncbi:hypothetical protein NC651_017209 [Populus alba x Populus x berolinensis]|nr:hypothetical protein NC651_017209 [Populus alba x Populus x berolinensis]